MCHLAGHPTQQHLVAAGGEDGTLAIWDMRNMSHPFSIIAAHSGPSKKPPSVEFAVAYRNIQLRGSSVKYE